MQMPDLSFLDDEIDFGTVDVERFMNELLRFDVVFCSNDEPDIRVIQVLNEEDLMRLMGDLFGNGDHVTQIVIPNTCEDLFCTHLRIIACDYHKKSPVNYKLNDFLRKAKGNYLSSRCSKALIVGMTNPMSGFVSVPAKFVTTTISNLIDNEPIEMQSSEMLGLMNIPGTSIMRQLPDEMQWHVFKYCQHPVASIMRAELDRVSNLWDWYFNVLFDAFIAPPQ
jgi:hypothetical protein